MAFQPRTFEQAKLAFKPLRRSPLSPRPPLDEKPLLPTEITRERASGKQGRPLKRTAMKRRPIKSSTVPYGSLCVSRKKKARKKRLTDGQLKKRVWKEFSVFIRTREADAEGMVKCTTCDVVKHWKEMQAGHFIRGRLNANLFEERGCNVQCYSCNVGKQGEVVVYYKWMLARYGQPVIDELIQQNNRTKKWAPGQLQSLLDHYKALNASNPLTRKPAS